MADVAGQDDSGPVLGSGSTTNLRQRKKKTIAKDSTHNEEKSAPEVDCEVPKKDYQIGTGTYWLTRLVLIRYLGFVYGEILGGILAGKSSIVSFLSSGTEKENECIVSQIWNLECYTF